MWFLILGLLVVIIVFSFLAGLITCKSVENNTFVLVGLVVSIIVLSLSLLNMIDLRDAATFLNGESGLLKSEIYEVIGEPAAYRTEFLVFLKDHGGTILPYQLPVKPPTIFKVIADEGGGLKYVLYPTISEPAAE